VSTVPISVFAEKSLKFRCVERRTNDFGRQEGRDSNRAKNVMVGGAGIWMRGSVGQDRHEFSWMHIAYIVTAYKFGSPRHGCCRRFRSTPTATMRYSTRVVVLYDTRTRASVCYHKQR